MLAAGRNVVALALEKSIDSKIKHKKTAKYVAVNKKVRIFAVANPSNTWEAANNS